MRIETKPEDRFLPLTSCLRRNNYDGNQWPTWHKLLSIMRKDRLYLNPYLMQVEVAEKLRISTRTLCRLLTNYGEMNFNSFVNRYRIEEACGLMKDRHNNENIETIAERCGFNSRASFYRSFSSLMGVSPNDYRKQSR